MTAKVHDINLEYCRLKFQVIGDAVYSYISSEWVYNILTYELYLGRLPVRWKLLLSTQDLKPAKIRDTNCCHTRLIRLDQTSICI